MSNTSFKSGHSYVPKLTEENYPTWKQKICKVLITKKAYNIVPGIEPPPPGNGAALHALQEDGRDRADKAIALIHLGCWDKLLPLINNIDDPVEIVRGSPFTAIMELAIVVWIHVTELLSV